MSSEYGCRHHTALPGYESKSNLASTSNPELLFLSFLLISLVIYIFKQRCTNNLSKGKFKDFIYIKLELCPHQDSFGFIIMLAKISHGSIPLSRLIYRATPSAERCQTSSNIRLQYLKMNTPHSNSLPSGLRASTQ